MKPYLFALLAACLVASRASAVYAAAAWTEGTNYFLITPARPTSLAFGQVEVTEIFSYACPACNQFVPIMHKLKQALPTNVVVDYIPASFNPAEDWPMFQLAFCTAQALGIAEQTHDAMFDAVWKTGELGIVDAGSQRLKAHLPTIVDAAGFYMGHAGVAADKFLSTAQSFAVDLKVRGADGAVQAYRVDRTPTIVVNGKYRLHAESAGGSDQLIELVKWLVAKESNVVRGTKIKPE